MLKLMKYEFRKQAFSKAVILSLVGLLELVFFFGVATSRENTIGTALGLLILFTFGAFFFIAFESIITFSNDLKQKCSYMLFLTPNTSYGIVGAKVLAAGLQVILAAIVFFLIFAIDGAVLVAKYDAVAQVKALFEELMQRLFNMNIQFANVVSVAAVMISSWICTITLAFFSITLSTTFLANKKYKGILSFVIFILLYITYNKIMGVILKDPAEASQLTSYFIFGSIIMLVFTVITYIGTSWMLEKKVSV